MQTYNKVVSIPNEVLFNLKADGRLECQESQL